MRASLRRLHSPDIYSLPDFRPEKADDFAFLLQVMVGPEGGEGEESFDVTVCTPKWLERTHERSEILIGRHLLILFEYDYGRLERRIKGIVDSTEGASWQEVAERLSRFGMWEFEDYSEARA